MLTLSDRATYVLAFVEAPQRNLVSLMLECSMYHVTDSPSAWLNIYVFRSLKFVTVLCPMEILQDEFMCNATL